MERQGGDTEKIERAWRGERECGETFWRRWQVEGGNGVKKGESGNNVIRGWRGGGGLEGKRQGYLEMDCAR